MYFKQDIEECVKVLKAGGLILYPTDTVWGIGCDAGNEKAVARIYQVKKRDEQKSMIILVADEKDILKYTDQQFPSIYDYVKGANKPVTVIYKKAINLAPNLVNSDGSIGIRVVKDEFCRRLIRTFGKPIVSTSSNISGYPAPGIFADIDIRIKENVDYIVHHRQDDMEPALPSTVIKLNADGSITVIRP